MALGLLFWAAWISLLLNNSVFTEAQGTRYRQTHDKLNLVDVNDFSDSLSLDEDEGELLSGKQSKVVNKEYKKSPAAQPLKLFSVSQNLVEKPNSNVARIVNGASRLWESNVLAPITFPLQSGSQLADQIQSMPVHESQSTPLAVYGSRRPVPPSLGETTTGIQMVKPKPVQGTNLVVSPPSFVSLQPVLPSNDGVSVPVAGSFYQQVDSPTAASPEFPDADHFSYQGSNMLEFSPSNIPIQSPPSWQFPKPQSESWSTPAWFGQGNEIDTSLNFALPNWLGFPHTSAWFPNPHIASRGYQPDFSQTYNYLAPWVIASLPKAPEPPRRLPPRKSFIIQSKTGYQRQRLLNYKTTYTPDYKMPQGKYGKSVKVLRGAVQNQNSRKI